MGQIYHIDVFPWGRPAGSPESQAELSFLKDELSVCLLAKERNPRCTVTELNGPVYRDSCLEFFFCPCPEKSPAYYNFELNAYGTLYVGFSPDGTRATSAPVDPFEYTGRIPTAAQIDSEQGFWNVRFRIPYDFIRARTPGFLQSGQRYLTGNFYKCGDDTENPHYAVWNPIDSNVITKPDFHVIKYFGKIEIK